MRALRGGIGGRAARPAALCALALAGAASGLDARAQTLLPEPHWGGWILPTDRPELRAALRLSRFTEFSKTGSRFNDIETTAGFNLASLCYSENTPGDPDLFFTIAAGVGYSGDQPTRFLQNDYVHDILGQDPVPVGATRDEVEYSFAGSIVRWFDGPLLFRRGSGAAATGWRSRFYAGAGVGTGTIHHEAHVDLGGTLLVPDTFLWGRHVRLSLANRLGFPTGGNAFPELADWSNVTQLALGIVPPRVHSDGWVWDFLGNPELGVTVTHDSGFFVRSDGDPIETWFAGLYVQWPTGLRFETWNDMANGTDFGPTFGMLVSFDLFTLFENSRWRW